MSIRCLVSSRVGENFNPDDSWWGWDEKRVNDQTQLNQGKTDMRGKREQRRGEERLRSRHFNLHELHLSLVRALIRTFESALDVETKRGLEGERT